MYSEMSERSFQRIVSLLASGTETVCALGLGDRLVGRSHECDFPPSVRALPECSRPRLSIEKKSIEIDRDLKSILSNGLSIYEVDVEKIAALAPDLIITQDHCKVCAVTLDDLQAAACDLIPSKPSIITLRPDTLDDVFGDIRRIAEELGNGASGEGLVRQILFELQGIFSRTSKMASSPRVAFIEWIEPLMCGGNWMPDLIRFAGGINLFGESGSHSPYLEMERLIEADPDYIVVAPCGFDLERAATEMEALRRVSEFLEMKAVREGRVAIADGNALFNRPGPRLLESTKVLESIFHGTPYPELESHWRWWT